MNYRHGFHADNHADVLKHLVLVQVLRYMAAKDKPYRLIDTHAGAGLAMNMTTQQQSTFDPHALLAETALGVLATLKSDGQPVLVSPTDRRIVYIYR